MPSKLKTHMLNELRSRFEHVENCVVMNFSGVSAMAMTELRSAVRKENGNVMVVKNSIATRAFHELGFAGEFIAMFDGPVILAYGDDPAAIVRTITDWDKTDHKLAVRGGMVNGRAIGQEAVGVLATLPPMPVMQAMAIGSVAAPLTSFLGLCKEVIRSFVRIVDGMGEKERGNDESPPSEAAEQ